MTRPPAIAARVLSRLRATAHRHVALLGALFLAIALSACGESQLTIIGYEGEETVTLPATTCDDGLCGAHGTCDDSSGTPVCICDAGYRGADCTRCAAGYINNGAGVCVDASNMDGEPDAGDSGDEGESDAGAEVPTELGCDDPDFSCGDHGTCVEVGDQATCECDTGYSGVTCQRCASGFQDNDGDGTCEENCATAGLDCGDHGACDDASGITTCACAAGYSGATCQSCAAGYQDNDGDGACKPNCATASLSCGTNEACVDTSGAAKCECRSGYVVYQGVCTLESSIAEWTFMVFLNGDNDLNEFGLSDLEEMQSLTNASKVNVIVLFDELGTGDSVVYKITKGGKTKLSPGSAIFSGSEADMGSADTLRKFGVWAIDNYPAQKFALVMWNHGGGWREGDRVRCGREPLFKDFSNDETSQSVITLANGAYTKAIKAISTAAGKKLDLIGFDTCLMGMYEVAAVNAPYGDYLVASAESEPAYGWTYDVIMKKLGNKPGMDAVELGKIIVDSYYDYSSGNATLALFDLSKTDNMTDKIDTFATNLQSALSTSSHKSAIQTIRQSTQHYGYNEHVDLKHFATQIKNKSSLPSALKTAASDLLTQISSFMIYAKTQSNTSYWDYSHANASGLAIFFPEEFGCCTSDDYGNIDECYSVLSPCTTTEVQEASGWYSTAEMTTYKSGSGAVWSSKWKNFVRKYSGID